MPNDKNKITKLDINMIILILSKMHLFGRI